MPVLHCMCFLLIHLTVGGHWRLKITTITSKVDSCCKSSVDWSCFLNFSKSSVSKCFGLFYFSGFAFLFLINFSILFQGWKRSSSGLLPVSVPGAVCWIARDIQVRKPAVRTDVGVFISENAKSFEKEWWDFCCSLSFESGTEIIFLSCYSVAFLR